MRSFLSDRPTIVFVVIAIGAFAVVLLFRTSGSESPLPKAAVGTASEIRTESSEPERNRFRDEARALARELRSKNKMIQELKEQLAVLGRSAESALPESPESQRASPPAGDEVGTVLEALGADEELKANWYAPEHFRGMFDGVLECFARPTPEERGVAAKLTRLYFQLTAFEHRRGLEPKTDFGDDRYSESPWTAIGSESPEFAAWDQLLVELGSLQKLAERVLTDSVGKENCELLRKACDYPSDWSSMSEGQRVAWRVTSKLALWRRFFPE